MSILATTEVTGGRGGQWQLNGAVIARTKQRKFLVQTDSKADDEGTVLAASGVPRIGHSISVNGSSIVLHSKSASPAGESFPKLWYVECQYKPRETEDPDEGDSQEPPENRPAEVSFTTEIIEEVVWGSYTQDSMADDPTWSVVYKNSAGEPFDPPPTEERPILVMSVSQYETKFQTSKMATWAGTVNKNLWQGGEARTVKLRSIQANREIIDQLIYWKLSVEFAWRADKWDKKYLDAGTYYLDDDGDKQSFLTADNVPFVGLLNGTDGGELDVGVDPKILTFENKRVQDFNQLKLRV